MVEVSPKFFLAIAVAAIMIFSGLTLYHTNYDAVPYEKIIPPTFFQGEQKMLAFSPFGSSASPISNATVNIYGYVRDTEGTPLSDLNLSVYIFPWVVHFTTGINGYYHVVLLKYGTFTAGYISQGYSPSLKTFTILSGNTLWENVTLSKAKLYSVTGQTVNITNSPVNNVKIYMVTFFGQTITESSNDANFSVNLQDATYGVITIKKNYNPEPKPLFFNVTGSPIDNLRLVMNMSSNISFLIYGYVTNKLDQPVKNAVIYSQNQLGQIDSGKVETNSSGYYNISVPAGYDEIIANGPSSGPFYQTNNSPVLIVNSNKEYNFSMTAYDPFTLTHTGPTGLGFLPSFETSSASLYFKNNLSGVNYVESNPSGQLTLTASNIFYNTAIGDKFMKPLKGVVAVDVLGTIFYKSIEFSEANGTAIVPSYYDAHYKMMIYVYGFYPVYYNLPMYTNTMSVSLTPMPGQIYSISENITGYNYSYYENGELITPLLQYPNLTLYENNIVVNTSFYSDYFSNLNGKIHLKRTFYYFIDTQQNYEENFTLNTSEVGFQGKNYSFSVDSLKAKNLTLNITLNASNSIGYNLTRVKFNTAPGVNSTYLGGFEFKGGILNDTGTSNNNNTGKGVYYIHLLFNGQFNKNISEPFAIYAREDGFVYSGIVYAKNSVIVLNTNFTGFDGAGLSLYVVSQNYTGSVVNISKSGIRVVSIELKVRDLTRITISTSKTLYRIYDNLVHYNSAYSTFTYLGMLRVGGYSLPLNYTTYLVTYYYTNYTYNLPVNVTYTDKISYANIDSGFLNNSSVFSTFVNSEKNLYLNISSYGTILNISTPINLTISEFQGSDHLTSYTISASKERLLEPLSILNISHFGSTGYYEIENGTQSITTKSFAISQDEPLAMEYVNITPGETEFRLNSYANGIISNSSVLINSGRVFLENMTFYNSTVSNGQIAQGGHYYVSENSVLTIGIKSYTFTGTEYVISNLQYPYPGGNIIITLKIYSGTPETLFVIGGYLIPSNNVYSRGE
ncbi:hypothetical protein ACNF42_01620 [Cuniculiplasma sp. SKW3]|uniref:hypothetical protein n=1 Tax=Cuniculiplasma sp. SKW3 TaxID=3400170 RepID=UPI003FD31824